MSETNHIHEIEDESPSEPNKGAAKEEITSRRRFMRHAVTGAVGASFVLSVPHRSLARQTARHVDDFLNRAKQLNVSEESRRELQRVCALIFEAANRDQKARAGLDEIRAWLDRQSISISIPRGEKLTELGLPWEASALVVVAYLRALSALQGSSGRLTLDDLKNKLASLRKGSNTIEQDFLDQLHIRTKSELRRDPAFVEKITAATRELAMLVHKLGGVGKPQSLDATPQYRKVQEVSWNSAGPPPGNNRL